MRVSRFPLFAIRLHHAGALEIHLRFPPIPILVHDHGGAPTPARDTIRVSLQFHFFMLAHRFFEFMPAHPLLREIQIPFPPLRVLHNASVPVPA